MTIKIDNPEIEEFFKNELGSDIKKFSEFILFSLHKYKKGKEFDVKTLDPKKNSYRLNYNIDEVDESSNPFKDIKDVTSYAKELRDKAWR